MLTTDEIPAILESAYEMRKEICLCLMGAPGIGKTQGIYEFAKQKRVKVVEIIASQILPNEVSGITMPVNETHSMEIYDHARLSSLKDGDILFFDELLQAAPQTLSACLTLIQERRMMSGKMLPDVMIVAAANPVTAINTIPLSIRQRFMFIDVKWEPARWAKYIKDTYGISLDSSLWKFIKTSGSTWNVLTPRSMTKLIAWGKQSKCSLPWQRVATEITGDELIMQKIMDVILNVKRSGLKQITDALEAAVGDGTLEATDELWTLITEASLDRITLREMVEKLQELPEWEKISAVLENQEED